MFKPHDIVTRKNTREGRGEVLGDCADWLPHRPERVWVKWQGSDDEEDHYDPSELDYFNPETDEP